MPLFYVILKRIGGVNMKILMIPSWYGTKSAPLLGSFYKEQAEALAALGHDVAVLYAEVGGSFSRSVNGLTHEVVNGVNTYTYVGQTGRGQSALVAAGL